LPLTAAALQIRLRHPAVAAIILGAVHPGEVQRNLAQLRTVIPADLCAELKAEGLFYPAAPVAESHRKLTAYEGVIYRYLQSS
jgi:D-threo-aldose 1-dehydrogenase